ncbi:hypothetical protein PybrP1_006191 [[Pythium] brassicae (nom. inval.)]|nr:hypothetical protein PybrP1_006191 [[Pythium] brassicae (nom. inval.)]
MTQSTLPSQTDGAPTAKGQTEIQPQGCTSEPFIQAVKDGDLDAAQAIHNHDPEQAVCTRQIVQLAAMSTNVALLDWTHSLTNDDCSKAFLHYVFERVCLKSGHLDVFKWLHERSYRFCTPAMFRAVAEGGDMDTMLWMIEHYPESFELSKSIRMDNAAGYNNLHMIKWLHENDFSFSGTAIDIAAQHGLLHIVQWLHENRVDGCSTWAMDSAATFGHLDAVLFLHFHRSEGCTTVAMDLAAENGHLDVLQFLHHHRPEGCTTAAMDNAASVEILDFLHDNRSEGCTDEIVAKAVAKANVPVLRWVYANKRDLVDLDAVRALAVQHAKLEVIAWADDCVVEEAVAARANERREDAGDGGDYCNGQSEGSSCRGGGDRDS